MSSKKVGRPSNAALLSAGKIPISKRCKVCQSGAKDEISQMMLQKCTYRQIIEKFGHLFKEPLTPTNLNSHKQHISFDNVVKEDRKRSIDAVVEYDDTTKALFKQRYNKEFDKAATADALYKQRLDNLLHLQREIAQITAREKAAGNIALPDADLSLRRSLVTELETAYKGFMQDLLKHVALDADLYQKQVSLVYIQQLKDAFLRFSQKFINVIVKEIDDQLTRERVLEQLGDLLEREVEPTLDPRKAIDVEFEIENE